MSMNERQNIEDAIDGYEGSRYDMTAELTARLQALTAERDRLREERDAAHRQLAWLSKRTAICACGALNSDDPWHLDGCATAAALEATERLPAPPGSHGAAWMPKQLPDIDFEEES